MGMAIRFANKLTCVSILDKLPIIHPKKEKQTIPKRSNGNNKRILEIEKSIWKMMIPANKVTNPVTRDTNTLLKENRKINFEIVKGVIRKILKMPLFLFYKTSKPIPYIALNKIPIATTAPKSCIR